MSAQTGCCADGECSPETCMELPDGLTCADCSEANRCVSMFGAAAEDGHCQWFPRKFQELEPSQWAKDLATKTLAVGVKRCKCGDCDAERLRCKEAVDASFAAFYEFKAAL